MHIIQFDGKQYNCPSNWKELNQAALLLIAATRHRQPDGLEAIKELAPLLAGLSAKAQVKLWDFQRVEMSECLEWMHITKCDIEDWLIPTLGTGKRRLHGPKKMLSTMSGNEFIYAELTYQKWLFDNNIDHLKQLTAVLYRKKGTGFNPETIQDRVDRLAWLPDWMYLAIALNYSGCRNNMIMLHPHIWKATAPAEEDGSGQQQPAAPTSWTEIFLGLAESGKFGDFNSTIKYNVWLLLKDLDRNAQKIEELEAKR